jgi:5-dehydro-2-deoxygluconokinase
MDRERVYMLAADHRWQWEEWCDRSGVARSRIPEAKAAAVEGFLRARERSEAVRRHGALLLDESYASAPIRRALEAGVVVGTAAEAAGAFPLRWATDPFWGALTGVFVKVLVRHRPDQPADVQEAQRRLLLELQAWSRQQGKPYLVEVLIPTAGESEAELDPQRPAILAEFIAAAYAAGLIPDFWKLEGTSDPDAASLVDRAVAAQAGSRLLVLGKGADVATVKGWFAAARHGAAAAGFAIGRTAYWGPATRLLRGESDPEGAADAVAEGYLELISLWESALAE